MARRNGRVLARAVAAAFRRHTRDEPRQPAVEYWKKMLDTRPGWQRVRSTVYQFRTGGRLDLGAHADPLEWMRELAKAELSSIGAGMNTSVQEELLKESVAAAGVWWAAHRNGKKP